MRITLEMPPKTIGLTKAEAVAAYEAGATVRHWPLIGKLCCPHVGRIRGVGDVGGGDGLPVVWIDGKASYALASHCEVVR